MRCTIDDSNGNGTVTITKCLLLFFKLPFYILIQTQRDQNVVMLLTIVYEGLYSFGILFMSCEIGHQLSTAFEEYSILIDQLKWYLFPVEVQRIMPIVIHFGQQPVLFYCFGSTACTRDTYKRVCINLRN